MDHMKDLFSAFIEIKRRYRFSIDALVILPSQLHCILTLQEGQPDFLLIWQQIKAEFCRQMGGSEDCAANAATGEDHELWLECFSCQALRDNRDFARQMDDLHYHPVRHGQVKQVSEWPYSTFFQYVQQGVYPLSWSPESAR
jgi:putative transposase